jgi:hypothetical protein
MAGHHTSLQSNSTKYPTNPGQCIGKLTVVVVGFGLNF